MNRFGAGLGWMRHVLFLVLMAGSPVSGQDLRYEVGPQESQLVVVLRRGGIASGLAHDHAVEATRFRGVVHCDPRRIGSGRIELRVDARSLVPDRGVLRQQFGLEGEIDAGDRAKILKTLHGPDQLDTQRYPSMTFVSTRVEGRADGRWVVLGEWSIRGVTRKVECSLTVTCTPERFEAIGTLRFRQSSFGYRPYRIFLGAIQVRDEAVLHLRIRATRSSPK